MRVAARDLKPHRPTRAKLAVLAALLVLSAAALAPASASAMTDQTTCLNTAIPGVGLVPGMGVAKDSDGNLYVCKLDSAGDLYGGTDKKASIPTQTPTPTSPICGRGCLPLEIGGGGGRGSNRGEAAGPRPGRGVTPILSAIKKQAKNAGKKKTEGKKAEEKPPEECQRLEREALFSTPDDQLPRAVDEKLWFLWGQLQEANQKKNKARDEGRFKDARWWAAIQKQMGEQMAEEREPQRLWEWARQQYREKGCEAILNPKGTLASK